MGAWLAVCFTHERESWQKGPATSKYESEKEDVAHGGDFCPEKRFDATKEIICIR